MMQRKKGLKDFLLKCVIAKKLLTPTQQRVHAVC